MYGFVYDPSDGTTCIIWVLIGKTDNKLFILKSNLFKTRI